APWASRNQRNPSASRWKKPSGGLGRVLIRALRPLLSRSRVVVQMSPPATGVVDTTATPNRASARAAVPDKRAIVLTVPDAAARTRSVGLVLRLCVASCALFLMRRATPAAARLRHRRFVRWFPRPDRSPPGRRTRDRVPRRRAGRNGGRRHGPCLLLRW